MSAATKSKSNMFRGSNLCIVKKIPEYGETNENNEVAKFKKTLLLLPMKQVKYLCDIYQVLLPCVTDKKRKLAN